MTVFLCLFCMGIFSSASAKQELFTPIDNVWFYADGTKNSIPISDASWQEVTLPFHGAMSAEHETLWFKVNLPKPVNNHPQAIYIPQHVFELDVYLNGIRLG
ncbi:MAG: hypothetical protein V3U78_02715, partial [Thiotrichaceae bacterium]